MEQITAWVADDQNRESEEGPGSTVAAFAVLVACIAALILPAGISLLALAGWLR